MVRLKVKEIACSSALWKGHPLAGALNFAIALSKPPRTLLPLEEGATMMVAFGLDALGEPPAKWHPVVWYGKLIHRMERSAPQRPVFQFLYGIGMLVLAAPAALLPALFVHRLAVWMRNKAEQYGYTYCGMVMYALLEGGSLKPFFALTMLVQAGNAVRQALERQDVPTARQALQSLVSRDRSRLTEELAAAAAIESLAENLSDSVVAPLMYYTLFGLPGAATYRLFNTFDSMVGYHGRYEYLGKAAAHLDDLLNLLPARLTGLLIVALAPCFGGDRNKAWKIWRRDARKTDSPNAGQPMSATAGALGFQLEKVDHYTLGDSEKPITAHDIRRAEQIVWWVGSTTIFLTALLKILWRAYGRFSKSEHEANCSRRT